MELKLLTPETIQRTNETITRLQQDFANATEGDFKEEDMQAMASGGDFILCAAQARLTLRQVVEMFDKAKHKGPTLATRCIKYQQIIEQLRQEVEKG